MATASETGEEEEEAFYRLLLLLLNSFLMKHNLCIFHKLDVAAIIDRASSSTLSNSAVTVHLALLYTRHYSLCTHMLSTCLLSNVSQIEGCSAGLDVDAMVCMLT